MIPLYKVRQHLRVSETYDDDLIENIVERALQIVERDSNVILKKRVFQQYFDTFQQIEFAAAPLNELVSLSYRNTLNVWTEVDADFYVIDGDIDLFNSEANGQKDYFLYPKIRWEEYPSDLSDKPRSVLINYSAGYEFNEAPKAAEVALLLMCGSLYENVEGLSPVNLFSVPAYEIAISAFKRPMIIK